MKATSKNDNIRQYCNVKHSIYKLLYYRLSTNVSLSRERGGTIGIGPYITFDDYLVRFLLSLIY